MKAYWLNDGNPLTEGKHAGRYGRVSDLEDGTDPVTTYGATQEEVMGKIERTMMASQMHVRTAPPPPSPGNQPPAAPAPKRGLSPEQVMQATLDLQDPGKSQQAIAVLLESATGISLDKMILEQFQRTCLDWEANNPEFYGHYTNRKLMADNLRMRNGGTFKNVTLAMLDQVHNDLSQGGYLLTREDFAEPAQLPTPQAPPQQTADNRADTRTPSYATGHRSTRLRAPQSLPSWTPKYTRAQIDAMPLGKSEELIRTNDKDYHEAVEHWYGRGQRQSA